MTREILDEKIAIAEESHELKAGTKIRILKVAKNKVGLTLEVEKTVCRMFKNANEVEELREFSNISKEVMMFIPHNDLMLGFDLLRSHLLIITEQREAFDQFGNIIEPSVLDNYDGEFEELNPLEKVKVNSFDLSSGYGISITGTKLLKGKKVLPLSTDKTYFEGYEDDEYMFGDELKHVALHLHDEVLAYYNGKYMPDAQTMMEFPEETDDSSF